MTTKTPPTPVSELDVRITAIEDRLAIYNLIASHPPIIDTQDMPRMKDMFTPDGKLDRGAQLGAVNVHDLPNTADPSMLAAATEQGLVHLSMLPYVVLGDNTATALSYVAATIREPDGAPIAVPAHGEGRGHRLFRITANRWDLVKDNGVWKIARRTLTLMDGTPEGRALLAAGLDQTSPGKS